jgi:two-component system, OmpR family, sensor kinase
VNPLRTVGGRLALALLVVVGGTLAIVYLIVVPTYQSNLVDSELKSLRHTLALIAAKPRASQDEVFPSNTWIEDEALPVAGGARVVIFGTSAGVEPVADSNGGTSLDIEHDSIARRAAAQSGVVSGSVDRDGSEYAEAAVAVPGPNGSAVLLVATPLHNDLESVEVVRGRVILAAILATGFAIVLGWLLASGFARRIRRLEAAAEQIADGRFDEPVVDDGADELGQLAGAFERMRLRLASLDRARSEFIANASHELRTPLFSLAGFLELLGSEDDVDPETREEFLTSMRGQVARLTKLATDLLDLSRLDAGRLTIENEGLDLAVLGDLLETEFGPRAAATGHLLELAVDGPVFASGDEGRVLQIGRNLIENAITHTPPGTAITVTARTEGHRAALSVADDGPGIPGDAREAVFDRFYRLGGTVASGSGLGLAIARELAELMGGDIELESRPGLTRFTLVLPSEAGRPAKTLVSARRG